MKQAAVGLLCCFLLVTGTGCALAEGGEGASPEYESTKRMLVDLLKTDEGKKAIQEIITDEEIRHEMIVEQSEVKKTIEEIFTAKAKQDFWQTMMQDSEFAKSFAEAMQSENEKVIKSLMKDPEYQEMLMAVLQDPEMEQASLKLMESKEYRKQLTTIMAEAFESPLFKAKINEILMSATEEQLSKQETEGEGSEEESQGESEEGEDGEESEEGEEIDKKKPLK